MPKVIEKYRNIAVSINSTFDVHFKLILIFSFLFQGFILFSNSYFEDSTLLIREFESGNFIYFKEKLILDGLPLIAYLHDFIGSFQHYLFLYKIIGFLAFFFAYYFFFKLLQVFNWLTTYENLLLATITMLIPNYFNWYEPIFAPYSICFSLFIYSCYWYVNYYSCNKFLLRMIAVTTFILSFSLGALLVYTYSFLLILFIWKYKKNSNFLSNSIFFIKNNWILIILPVLYRTFFVIFFPAQDGYNTVSLILSGFLYRFPKSLYYIGIFPIDKIKELFLSYNSTILFIIGLSTIIVITIIVTLRRFIKDEKREYTNKRNYLFLAAACFLLFCAIFPFVAVRKMGNYRNPLLLIPLGLIIFSCSYIILKKNAKYLIFLGIFILLVIQNYIHISIQSSFMRRLSVIENLKTCKNLKDIVVFDGWKNNTIFYEWNYMLKKAVPNSSFFAFNIQEIFYYQNLPALKELTGYGSLYLVSNKMPKYDSISVIKLSENKKYDDIKILYNYLFCKENPKILKEYLNFNQSNKKNIIEVNEIEN